MLSEYPQEFITSISKPSRSSYHSPETTKQITAIIPLVEGVSETFKRIGNRFTVRTKQTFCGTLMRTGPITEATQMKQCVYIIPCERGRC
jgi:hypothetical protein